MPDYITIELSKTGKHAGKYKAIVDSIDVDLKDFNWKAQIASHTVYVTRAVSQDGKQRYVMMHRVILARKLERDDLLPHEQVDHINGNGLDNRRENLRLATASQNCANQRKPKNNTTEYKGVTYYPRHKQYVARIMIEGKRKFLGLFKTKEQAHEACCEARKQYHGEYANNGEYINEYNNDGI